MRALSGATAERQVDVSRGHSTVSIGPPHLQEQQQASGRVSGQLTNRRPSSVPSIAGSSSLTDEHEEKHRARVRSSRNTSSGSAPKLRGVHAPPKRSRTNL